MTSPRTTREALMAELLGDVDKLLARVEALPVMVAAAEEKMTSTAKALEDAGDKYRMAVTAFTEQAKNRLVGILGHEKRPGRAYSYKNGRGTTGHATRSCTSGVPVGSIRQGRKP